MTDDQSNKSAQQFVFHIRVGQAAPEGCTHVMLHAAEYEQWRLNWMQERAELLRQLSDEKLEHYQSIAAEQGSNIMRLRIALKVIREFGGFGEGFHGGVMATMTKWMDDGMDGPLPWPESVFFDTWAANQGMSNVDGFIGYRLTLKLNRAQND